MDSFVGALLGIGLLLILLLILYLVDRVNTIEKETYKMAQSIQPKQQVSQGAPDPFNGLAGRRLWDAMTGKPPANMAPEVLADIRERYDLVLHKHFEALYKDGMSDGQRGAGSEPPNSRTINTAVTQVESWLPSAQVKVLYLCGLEASQRPPELWDSLRADMDEAANTIYGMTGMEVRQPLSSWLMPVPNPASAMDATDKPAGAVPDNRI